MADPEVLPRAERSLVLHLLEHVPPLADAITVAKRLNALLRRKASESLSAVLDAADRTPLKEFAAGLRRDVGAIQAALDLPWTTSPVEGQVNRLKMLKRTMYGPCRVPTPPRPRPPRRMTEQQHAKCGRTEFRPICAGQSWPTLRSMIWWHRP